MIKIIIADDHQIFIDGLLSFLKEEKNIEVVGTATNGQHALSLVKSKQVDIAVLDIGMHGLSPGNSEYGGIETAKKIVIDFPQTKVLMLTMFNNKKYIMNLIEIGASGYILKDKSKEELVGALNKISNGFPYYTDSIMKTAILARREKREEIKLTEREKEVLIKVGECFPTKIIAEKLFIAPATVETHIRNLLSKLDLDTRMHLVRYAVENGFVEKEKE